VKHIRPILVPLLLSAAVATLQAQSPTRSPLPEPDFLRLVGATLDSLANLGEFSGVVAIQRGTATVFQRAYGVRQRERGAMNDSATAFNVGSINKVFTATAIRQLAAEGKLHLDSTISAYWPDYPNRSVARRVTLRQLLAHSSGIGGDIFTPPAGRTRQALRHNRDFVQLFASRPLDFEPGTKQQYSNAGYVVLGVIIERVSRMDYYEYVRKNVYAPAGMARTGHWMSSALPPNTAVGYVGARGAGGPNTASLPGRGSAAGGGYSTARDLLAFVRALREGRIRGGPPPGLGVAGGAPGLNAAVEGDLPGGYDLVVLANLDPPAAERAARLIRGFLGASD
jgi:D-alanyl-D-alanine carboxypeptidase